MFFKDIKMTDVMEQAKNLQKQMLKTQKELINKRVSAQSGGGIVEATVNGKGELLFLHLDPEIVTDKDIEMLTDLIVAAVSEAQRRAKEMMETEMKKLTGGVPMPGMF